MNQQDPALAFGQTTVFQLASNWLDNPGEDPQMHDWLQALMHPDPEQRRMAVFRMWQSHDARVRVPLLVALRDPDAGVRGEAAHGLVFYQGAYNQDAGNVEPLIAALLEGGRSVRSGAALALGFLKDRRVVEPLLIVFEEEIARRRQIAKESGRRYFLDHDLELIIGALARLGDERAVEPLIDALANLNWHGQGKIAHALATMKDRRAVKPLLAVLYETMKRVQEETANQKTLRMPILPEGLFWALNEFGERRAVKPLLILLANKRLPVWDRITVINALGQMGDARAVEPLCAVLAEKYVSLRIAAARALGQLGDPRAAEALCSTLTARSAHMRAASARALGQVRDARAVEPLLTLLQDTRVSVHTAALGALCKVGDDRAVKSLLLFLRQGSGRQRRAAAQALGRIGDVSATESLVDALQDQDRTVVAAARGC